MRDKRKIQWKLCLSYRAPTPASPPQAAQGVTQIRRHSPSPTSILALAAAGGGRRAKPGRWTAAAGPAFFSLARALAVWRGKLASAAAWWLGSGGVRASAGFFAMC
jgi:hypothetical protein